MANVKEGEGYQRELDELLDILDSKKKARSANNRIAHCPKCDSTKYRVKVAGRTVTYTCKDCGGSWQGTMFSPMGVIANGRE